MNRSIAKSTVCALRQAGAARHTSAAAPPRIRLSLDGYLAAGRAAHRGCFACGAVTEPMPLGVNDDQCAGERRCGHCNAAAAVELQQAVREGWLRVE